jgi:hypothetical protein
LSSWNSHCLTFSPPHTLGSAGSCRGQDITAVL